MNTLMFWSQETGFEDGRTAVNSVWIERANPIALITLLYGMSETLFSTEITFAILQLYGKGLIYFFDDC